MNIKVNKKLIDDYIKKYNLTYNEFCKKSKISPKTLKNIISGNLNYYLSFLLKLTKILNVDLKDLFSTN